MCIDSAERDCITGTENPYCTITIVVIAFLIAMVIGGYFAYSFSLTIKKIMDKLEQQVVI